MESRDPDRGRFSGLLVDAVARPATASLCLAAILLSLAMWSGREVPELFMDYRAFGAQPWRLLTATLLHVNLIHLVFNVAVIWSFGGRIEARAGFLATSAMYLLLGAGSSAAEFIWGNGGIGLSGIAYGLFGLLYVADRRSPSWRGTMDASTTRWFVGWFFFCILATALDVLAIGNVAHGSGAVLGAALGLTTDPSRRTRALGGSAAGALLVLFLLAASVGRPLVNHGRSMAHEHLARAAAAFTAKDLASTARHAERAVALAEDDWRAWWYVAAGRDAAGDARGTDAALVRAMELAPDEPSAKGARSWWLHRQGYAALEQRDTSRAIELFEQALAIEDSSANTWFDLGIAHHRRSEWKEAGRAYRKALEIDPTLEGAREGLAAVERGR